MKTERRVAPDRRGTPGRGRPGPIDRSPLATGRAFDPTESGTSLHETKDHGHGALRSPSRRSRSIFTVEEANKALPLVKAIVGDIVRQFQVVNELKQRLSAVQGERRRPAERPLRRGDSPRARPSSRPRRRSSPAYIDELTRLGVELKGPDGLCDFPSLRDGREVYLCWRLGEPEVIHWHELNAGVAGRQPLDRPSTPARARRPAGSSDRAAPTRPQLIAIRPIPARAAALAGPGRRSTSVAPVGPASARSRYTARRRRPGRASRSGRGMRCGW